MLVHAQRTDGFAGLAEALTASFEAVRAALDASRPVVIVVDDADLCGSGDPAQAALAAGLLGLARALAIEGREQGWRIAVLATTPAVTAAERGIWLDALERSPLASGSLLRLGGEHLGKAPV